jgi:hypothetical protein
MFFVMFIIFKYCYNFIQLFTLLYLAFKKFDYQIYVCLLNALSILCSNLNFITNLEFPTVELYLIVEGILSCLKYLTLYVLKDEQIIVLVLVSSCIHVLYIVVISMLVLYHESSKTIKRMIPVEGEYEDIELHPYFYNLNFFDNKV